MDHHQYWIYQIYGLSSILNISDLWIIISIEYIRSLDHHQYLVYQVYGLLSVLNIPDLWIISIEYIKYMDHHHTCWSKAWTSESWVITEFPPTNIFFIIVNILWYCSSFFCVEHYEDFVVWSCFWLWIPTNIYL